MRFRSVLRRFCDWARRNESSYNVPSDTFIKHYGPRSYLDPDPFGNAAEVEEALRLTRSSILGFPPRDS